MIKTLFQDNIIFEKIWQDTDFFQLKIICSSNLIIAITESYLDDSCIDDLIDVLEGFLNGDNTNNYWQCGDLHNNGIYFEFTSDKTGHIKIEVYMKLLDGDHEREHECCFFVNTEHGMLRGFMMKLHHLKQNKIGVKVSLADMH